MNKKILLVGGGGHCKSVLDSILERDDYTEIGIVDKIDHIGKSVMGVSIVGCDDDLQSLYTKGYHYAFVTIGSIGNPSLRIKLFNLLTEIGYAMPSIIDPSAKVSHFSEIHQGVFIGKQSIVNAGSIIQKGCILNSGAIVEHDCQIGAFVHIAPGAVLGGEVVVGDNSHIGSNASIKQQVHIGSNSMIGMGSVVLHDIQDSIMAFGTPCKEVKKL